MYQLIFSKDSNEILCLEIDSTLGSLPRFISGDDSWFDYSEAVFSKKLNRSIKANESPKEWVDALSDSYKNNPINLQVKTINPEKDSPPIPSLQQMDTRPISQESEAPQKPPESFYLNSLIQKNAAIDQNPQNVNFNGMVLSGWWRRVGAYSIDSGLILLAWLVVFLIFLVLIQAVGVSTNTNTGETSLNGLAIVLLLIGFLTFIAITLAYYIFTMTRQGSKNGQTWGLQLLSIAVVRENGEKVDFSFVLLRQLLIIGLLFGFLNHFTFYLAFLLDSIWPLWDKKKQTLHDKIAKSYMVRSDIRKN